MATDATSQVLFNIEQAWDIANETIAQAEGFASNAVRESKAYIRPGFNQVTLTLPSSGDIDNDISSKISDIESNVHNSLTGTVPDAYNRLFKELINQGGTVTSAFGTGEADASDTMSLIDGMSDAFKIFNFEDNMGSLSTFLSTGMLTGGTPTAPYGVPVVVEQAITDRMLEKLDDENLRAEEEATAAFASRGFPLPPGVLSKRLNEIQDKGQMAKSSIIKDVAIEQGKRGFEAGQNYVKQFQSLQIQTADAFNAYLRTVISARVSASEDVKALVGSVSTLQASIVSLYKYTMDEREVLLKQAIAEGSLSVDQANIEVAAFTKHVEAAAGTAMAAAQSMGNLATAAVSSQNSMSRISADTLSKA